MNFSGILRTFHPNAEEYTFFTSTHGTFSRIDHILGHESNLSKFKKIEIISSIFFYDNAMRLDIIYKKKKEKKNKTHLKRLDIIHMCAHARTHTHTHTHTLRNTWRLNMFLNNQHYKPMDTLSLTKEARIYNGKKKTSLTSGAGKTGQPLVKESN